MNLYLEEWEEIDNSDVVITPNHLNALMSAIAERRYLSTYFYDRTFDIVGAKAKYTRRMLSNAFKKISNALEKMIRILRDDDSINYSDKVFGRLVWSKFPLSFNIGKDLNANVSLSDGCKRIKELIKSCHIYYEADAASITVSKKGWMTNPDKGWMTNPDLFEFSYERPSESCPDIILERSDNCSPTYENSHLGGLWRYHYENRSVYKDDDREVFDGDCLAYLNNMFLTWNWGLRGELYVYVEGFSNKYIAKNNYDWEEVDMPFFDFGTGLQLGWNKIDGIFKFGDLVNLATFGVHTNNENINLSDGNYPISFPGINEENVKYDCDFKITKIKIDFNEGFTYK